MSIRLTIILGLLVLGGCTSTNPNAIVIQSDVAIDKYDATLVGDFRVPTETGRHPTVVLMHGCGGTKKGIESLKAHARYLREHGYATLVLNSFGPRGLERQCNLMQLAHARDYRLYDAFNTLAILREHPQVDPDNIFLVGQSNGGSVAIQAASGGNTPKLNMSADLRFRAIVAYYPWCGVAMYETVSPILVFTAGQDDWIDPQECETKRKMIRGETMEVVMYPDALHSFDLNVHSQSYEGRSIGGHAPSRDDSRQRMLTFFENNRTH